MASPRLISIVFALALWPKSASADLYYGSIHVSTNMSREAIPAEWRELRLRITPLPSDEFKRSWNAVRRAIDKYPRKFVESYLTDIYLLRSFALGTFEYGGTYSNRSLILCNDGESMGFTDEYLEGTFHHEFSSLLKDKHWKPSDEKRWIAANPEGFQYRGYEQVFKNKGLGLDLEPKYNQMGFVCEYSMTSVEEDLNTVANELFVSSRKFWRAFDQYPRLRQKCRVAIDFYSRLDERFSEEYFRSLCRSSKHGSGPK